MFNSLLDLAVNDTSLCIGINRDLIFGNQKTVYRELKNNDFDLIFDINRNQGGYNHRDVHG